MAKVDAMAAAVANLTDAAVLTARARTQTSIRRLCLQPTSTGILAGPGVLRRVIGRRRGPRLANVARRHGCSNGVTDLSCRRRY